MAKRNITITVNVVPHPNPEKAIDLVAEIVFKQLSISHDLRMREGLSNDE